MIAEKSWTHGRVSTRCVCGVQDVPDWLRHVDARDESYFYRVLCCMVIAVSSSCCLEFLVPQEGCGFFFRFGEKQWAQIGSGEVAIGVVFAVCVLESLYFALYWRFPESWCPHRGKVSVAFDVKFVLARRRFFAGHIHRTQFAGYMYRLFNLGLSTDDSDEGLSDDDAVLAWRVVKGATDEASKMESHAPPSCTHVLDSLSLKWQESGFGYTSHHAHHQFSPWLHRSDHWTPRQTTNHRNRHRRTFDQRQDSNEQQRPRAVDVAMKAERARMVKIKRNSINECVRELQTDEVHKCQTNPLTVKVVQRRERNRSSFNSRLTHH